MTGSFPGAKAMIDTYWTSHKLPGYDFRLREEVEKSGKNIVLVAPSLGNSPNAYKNTLSNTPGGLDFYLGKVMQSINEYVCQRRFKVANINFSKLILAAHSAGGSQMRRMVIHSNPVFGNKLSACWGFDSLYGGVSRWLAWAKANPDKRLIVFYKGSTQGNALLLKQLSRRLKNVKVISSHAKNHYLVPIHHLGQCLSIVGS
jgi:hypothetical protein